MKFGTSVKGRHPRSKMSNDYRVAPRSSKEIEALTLAWRDTLGVPNDWAPDILRLLEIELARLPDLGQFALIARSDSEMGDAEAYTQFNPPHIVVRNSVYQLARRRDGRSRMTLAHELGHLVMHPGASKLRTDFPDSSARKAKPYEFAEWQANKFASLFLMPLHVIRDFASAAQIAECCHVSIQAAEIRYSQIKRPKQLPDCIRQSIEDLTKS
jgi:IrrE N-terminal-like domain